MEISPQHPKQRSHAIQKWLETASIWTYRIFQKAFSQNCAKIPSIIHTYIADFLFQRRLHSSIFFIYLFFITTLLWYVVKVSQANPNMHKKLDVSTYVHIFQIRWKLRWYSNLYVEFKQRTCSEFIFQWFLDICHGNYGSSWQREVFELIR